MKVSIITVSYNSGATIRDTFESVLSQTYSDIEYIVVDGASKDNTLDLIKEYEPRFDGKMRWVSERDKGLFDAMNKGIAMATGDVVGILNSDDFYYRNNSVETFVAGLIKADVDAVYGDVVYVNKNDIKKKERYFSSKKFKRSLMPFGFIIAHPSWFCKREMYEKYGSFDCEYRVAADFDNLLRMIYVNKISIKYLDDVCVIMRDGGNSSSGLSCTKQIIKDHLKIYKKNSVYSNLLFELLGYCYKVIDRFYYNQTKLKTFKL